MEFLKQNKKIIVILGVLFLLLIINTSVNMVATGKIDDEIQSTIKDLNVGDDVEIEYEDISYSFISSTLSFDNISIGEDDEYLKIEELSIKFDPDAIPSKKDLQDGKLEVDLSDFKLSLENLKFVADGAVFKQKKLNINFDGSFSGDMLSTKYLLIDAEGTDLSADGIGASIGNLGIKFESENSINIMDIEREVGKIKGFDDLNDMSLEMNVENYDLSRAIVKEFNLDDLGISELEGKEIELRFAKDNQEVDFGLELGSESIGSIDVEGNLDFSKDTDDPYVELKLTLEDLDKNIDKMLKMSKLKETKNGYELDFEGSLNKLQKSIF